MNVKIGKLYKVVLKLIPDIVEAILKLAAGEEVKVKVKELEALGIEIVIRKVQEK